MRFGARGVKMKKRRRSRQVRTGLELLVLLLVISAGWRWSRSRLRAIPVGPLRPVAAKIVAGAKAEVRRGVRYDASYRLIAYPMGDVEADRGACTDVVIRSLRHAGFDLQALIHADMRRHFALYPHRYGLSRPDANIDHRRVPNHLVFFSRYVRALPTATDGSAASTWQPGDLVYWRIPGGPLHCGVLSDVYDGRGMPLVIHNMGQAREEDCLTAWPIVAHFRYPPESPGSRRSGPAPAAGTPDTVPRDAAAPAASPGAAGRA
jgi:uncharacterized protein YijF (DUF1287 family)